MTTLTGNKQGIEADRDRREPLVANLPYYYHVHLNEPCNQRCIMCVPDGGHGKGVLPLERFMELFEQVKPFAEHITLIGGEPLMYPWIGEVLGALAEHPIAVTINTNATMLDEGLCRRLMALHELHLKWSIDAATPDTYRLIRGRDHFKRVTTNVRRFVEAAGGRPSMRLIPVFVVMRANIHEAVPFVAFAKQFSPERIEFHPVRHVGNWVVDNGTGWTFDGREQVCESFSDIYDDVMSDAAETCRREGIECEIHLL